MILCLTSVSVIRILQPDVDIASLQKQLPYQLDDSTDFIIQIM